MLQCLQRCLTWQHPGNVCSTFRFWTSRHWIVVILNQGPGHSFHSRQTSSSSTAPLILSYDTMAELATLASSLQQDSSGSQVSLASCPTNVLHEPTNVFIPWTRITVLRVSAEASSCNHPHRGHLPERQHSSHPFHPPAKVIQKPLICKRRCGRPSSRPEHWNGTTMGYPHNLGITARSLLQHAASLTILWQEMAPPAVWRQEERFWDLKQLASAINVVQRLYLQTTELLRCHEISSFYDGESGYVHPLPGQSPPLQNQFFEHATNHLWPQTKRSAAGEDVLTPCYLFSPHESLFASTPLTSKLQIAAVFAEHHRNNPGHKTKVEMPTSDSTFYMTTLWSESPSSKNGPKDHGRLGCALTSEFCLQIQSSKHSI